jgi:hypothetical protein
MLLQFGILFSVGFITKVCIALLVEFTKWETICMNEAPDLVVGPINYRIDPIELRVSLLSVRRTDFL